MTVVNSRCPYQRVSYSGELLLTAEESAVMRRNILADCPGKLTDFKSCFFQVSNLLINAIIRELVLFITNLLIW